jgi:predicted DNA-binding transcriptional regulator YafY
MRRADRLFQIIQILRRNDRLTRAQDIAEEMEISVRTVYRDISDLIANSVPIEGARGLGYVLHDGYTMPPLMFTPAEIDSIVLGARIVETWADRELSDAAMDVLAKIEAVVPKDLRPLVISSDFSAPGDRNQVPVSVDLKSVRTAIRSSKKIKIIYRDGTSKSTERSIRPLTLSFYGPVWLIVAWCELRQDFRTFRADRLDNLMVTETSFAQEPGKRLVDYLKRQEEGKQELQR